MKLYVCYGTFKFAPRPGGHPCGNAYHALVDAGYKPEVIRSYGWGLLPEAFNQTAGRREVKRLTGNNWLPALVTDDGEVIQGSDKIIAWAEAGGGGASAGDARAGDAGAGASAPAEARAAGAPDSPAT